MKKDVDLYLSKGFSKQAAEYFSDGRRRIKSVIPNKNFTLTIEFDNNEQRLFDVSPLLCENTVFAPFRSWANFKRVYVDDCNCISWDIDPEVDSNVVWSNKVDLCPDSCYIDSKPIKK